MKLPTLALVFATVISLTNASYLPGLVLQDQIGTYMGDSTKLITNCGDRNDILTIDYVTLTPDPPVKGEDLVIDFKGYLSETVPNGTTIELIVKFGVVKLIHKKFDFCEQVQEVNEKCPLTQGDYMFNKVVALPKEIPGGKYTVHAEIITPEEKRVACLVGQTTFPR